MALMASLLIANRGEIARRIIRTARRLGVKTIAVYSEADENAAHVLEADASALIGPALARESYLSIDNILDAADRTGATAIHPGYGFLSENADFAERVVSAGLVWVGPPPSAIRAMGLKDAAKRVMQAAGVPVTPGYLGEDQSTDRLFREAQTIGWPILIKAVAGGGGKGMRRVDREEEFFAALAGAQREGAASFGDSRVLLEKYVTHPRHIEVQIFGDQNGHVVHLFERDCSLQRRHQKVIEEAPAPGMDDATRAALCASAVRAGEAVGYVGAGTVEFIADASDGLRADRIWFMEMNTRLQVEHPVTEAVTGLDLVEWQLRVACGEPLPLRQQDIGLDGHAIEARLYAEDPENGFLPSTGRLTHFQLPGTVRIDSGYEQGDVVTPYYDPMLAKLIVHSGSRGAAAAALATACATVEVWPVKTNAAFLARAVGHDEFVSAHVQTGFIGDHLDELVARPTPIIPPQAVAALAPRQIGPASPWTPSSGLAGFRLNQPSARTGHIFVDGLPVEAAFDFESQAAAMHAPDGQLVVYSGGAAFEVSTSLQSRGGLAIASDGVLRAPMPGRVVQVALGIGDRAQSGQLMVVLEAMKMEHALCAPFEGIVTEISVSEGDQVTEGSTLARFEAVS